MTDIDYDVFISHAFEDKNSFTNELALALKQKGLKVWYSGFELKVGDSIADSVNNALKSSKYAVVVISPIYLEKTWAMNELQALFAQEGEQKRILPILHHIPIDQIRKHLPLMADRYALSSERNMEFISNKIMEVVTDEGNSGSKRHQSSQTDKKKLHLNLFPMIPVLLPLGAPRILLEKMIPDLKTIFKNRNGSSRR
jgi:hypothetical protein